MDKETLKALKGSIRKWEKIVDGVGVDLGSENCPLCYLYLDSKLDCKGCPVGKHCLDTVFGDWVLHHVRKHPNKPLQIIGKCRTCKKLARKELEFLQSLLPKEE